MCSSDLGVLVTAFVFIPGFSNYTAMLLLGLTIGVGTVALAFSHQPAPSGRGGVVITAALGVIICLIMLLGKDSYLRSLAKIEGIDLEMQVAAQYSSLYGTIKVVQATRSDGTNLRIYLQDGLVQNIVDPLGMSQSLHTHALEELGLAYAPQARSALVLGLAAGLVPMRFKAEGIDVTGPLPGDTIFVRAVRGDFDVVVACYHDQGLIPVKLLAFGHSVNVTIGLPIIRTSVDHGTAFDIAGQGRADHGSMVAAVRLAARLASTRPGA